MVTNLNYVVSSHVRYENVTLPRLLNSLTGAAGIPSERIVVVCGGSDRPREERRDGLLYSYVEHNSFDHTGLIDLVERHREGEFWFALHDTCEAGPRFYALSRDFDPAYEYVSTNRLGWHNMGAFSRGFLIREADYILSLKNCGKVKGTFSERVYPRLARSTMYGAGEMQFLGFEDTYGTGVTRARHYHPALDLYKYQANWQALEAPAVLAP